MVKYEIMKIDKFKSMKKRMERIEPEHFDQFVAGVIYWYQYEITHPTVYFHERPYPSNKPPNLFNFFEYPNMNAEAALRLFVESDTLRLVEGQERDYKDAKDIAIDTFNNLSRDYVDEMMHDVHVVLDGYQLFYCYQDDAIGSISHFNPYVKEVW